MILGIIGRLVANKFDGKILSLRISETYPATKNSYNSNLSTNVHINNALKNGDWRSLVSPYEYHHEALTCELFDMVQECYKLDTSLDLCFSYQTYTASGRTQKWVRITSGFVLKDRLIFPKPDGQQRELTFDDITLHKHTRPGRLLQKDCSCDSKFMLEKMNIIGQAIRSSYHWVNSNETIYLIMDNVGGHGTNIAKMQYTHFLKDDFNVEIVWQVPNSLEFNLSDLGAWVTIQSEVERVHRGRVMHPDVLVDSVHQAFQNLNRTTIYKNSSQVA